MSALLQWLTEPEWSQVVKTLLHSLWQGALIALALALAMRRVVNPHWRYRSSLLALAAIPVAGIITWAMLNTSNRPLTIATPAPVTTKAAAPATTFNQNPDTSVVLLANHSPSPPPVRWTAWLALIWIIGAGAMLGRAGIKLAGAEQLRRSCQPLENAQVTQLLAEACRAVGLARKIRVAVTDKLTSPAVVGVLVPTLILPLSLVTTLTPEQIRFILLHELAHIRRGDYFANLFQLFVEALLFFNPAVWWISHQVRREREACCDALAIELSGAPADYARTLVHVAENVLSPVPDAATAFGGKREPSSLADRVQRLLVPGYRPSLRLTWRAMIAAFVLGAVMLVLSAEGTRVVVAQITNPSAQTASEKEVTEQFSKSLSNFRSTDWLLTPDTLSGENQLNRQWFWYRTTYGSHVMQVDPDSGRGMADWKVDSGNKLTLPRLDISGVNEHSRVQHNADTGKTVITNGGLVRIDGMTIKADTIEVDGKTGKLIAQGNVRMERPGLTNNSTRVELNIYSNLPPVQASDYLIVAITEKRRIIATKLEQITLGHVDFDALPLSRVVLAVNDEARQRDPERRGVRIIINPNTASPEPGPAIDVGDIRITVNPPLTNVSLEDALNAIVNGASRPLKFSIEEYAVVISLKGQEITPLFVRQFKLAAAVFVPHLAEYGYRVEDSTSLTNTSLLISSVRSFFASFGVDLQSSLGKSVFFNDRRDFLLVRATSEELDRVEQLVTELNRPEPRINIKTRFVEVSPSELETFLPDLMPTMKATNSQSWSGILTKPQVNQVWQYLQTGKSVSLLSEGEVTTSSGRRAQIQTVEIKTVVSGINPNALVPPGITTNTESLFIATNLYFGPTIDIVPAITPDGYSVAMTVIPSVTEFLGYDGIENPTNLVVVYVNGKNEKTPLPLPRLRTQQMTNDTVVRDGMTLMLCFPSVQRAIKTKNQVPILGDIPGIGRLFRSQSSQTRTNILLVLVTPTIVDPAPKRPDTSANDKNGDAESFITSTNLRPVIDYHEPRIDNYRPR